MKLRLEDITGEARSVCFSEPERETNRVLELGPIREYHVDGPIAVTASYYRAGTEIFVEGELEARVGATCARCIDEFSAPSQRRFRYVLLPRVMMNGAQDGEEQSGHLELSFYDGEEIDLSPLVREQLLLALPTRALCSDDCRGLCQQCGVNLNRRQCACRPEIADPRLAALCAIKIQRQ